MQCPCRCAKYLPRRTRLSDSPRSLREISTVLRNTPQLVPPFNPKTQQTLNGTGCAQSPVRMEERQGGELMKILLAVDGSPCSDAAVEEVTRRPWPDDSTLRVLTAFEVPAPPTPEAWAVPLSYFEDMDVALRKQATTVLERVLQTLNARGNKNISVEGAVIPGSPRTVILDEAEDWGADLIVVGSHGYRAWERFLLGSVSQSVVSHAKCSVEVVRCRPAQETKKQTLTDGKR